MKYLNVFVEFCREYWTEIQHCANLTAALWLELAKLAPVLARKLREEME